MRFMATFRVNYRNILVEVKDIISSLDRFDSCLYTGKLLRQMQSNTTDNFEDNLNEIHSQFSAKFQEYPFEANDVKLSLDTVYTLCLLLGILREMKARNSIP